MDIALAVGGIVAGIIVVMTVIGLLLPKEHRSSRTMRTSKPPEEVWQVLTDAAGQTSWRYDLATVERVASDGREVWLEKYNDSAPVNREFAEMSPPRRMVNRFTDEQGADMGRWEYEITPVEGGAEIELTEYGIVANPFFRFVSRYMLGHGKFVADYLRALKVKLG
jgi:uncharacterized protein YndB with AHSA1/START domain